MTELSDDLLVAYVDGQLARDQSRAVKRVLDQDSVAAHRAETLRIAHDRLEWVLESLLDDERALLLGDIEPPPPSPPPRPTLRDRISAWGTATLASAGVAIALFGLFAGYGIWGGQQAAAPEKTAAAPAPLPQQSIAVAAVDEAASPAPAATEVRAPAAVLGDTPSWQIDVARAQALLARESLEVSLESQGNLDFVRFQLAKAVGADIVIPDLAAAGLTFVRAQVLRYRGEPLAQIAYLPASGAPVALYAKPGAKAGSGSPATTLSGLSAAAWSGNGISYLMIGQSPQPEFDRIATAARRQTLGL